MRIQCLMLCMLLLGGCQKPDSATPAKTAQPATAHSASNPWAATAQTLRAKQVNCSAEPCAKASVTRLLFVSPNQWLSRLLDDVLHDMTTTQTDQPLVATPSLQQQLDQFVRPDADTAQDELFAQYEMNVTASLKRQTATFLTIGIAADYYTGGAHGAAVQRYLNIDLPTHQVLRLDDVLQPEQQEKLKQLAMQHYVAWKQKNDPDFDLASDQEFWPFKLADEWTLTNQGLLLAYGQYEIASYAEGMPEFIIPYSQLQGIVKAKFFPSAATARAS